MYSSSLPWTSSNVRLGEWAPLVMVTAWSSSAAEGAVMCVWLCVRVVTCVCGYACMDVCGCACCVCVMDVWMCN